VSDALDEALARDWYHCLELAPGRVTQGMFDLRPYVGEYGIPERLDGLRVLEVGTWDGFWAFELESRGAAVVALDLDDEAQLDWPPRRRPATYARNRGDGFAVAKELRGSTVRREVCNVYDATPERLGGPFDLVFCGSVLIHLRDQFLALERMAALLKPGGRLISAEEYEPRLSLLPWPAVRYLAGRDAAVVFWLPAIKTWKLMLRDAGLDRVVEHGRFRMKATERYGGFRVPHVVLHGFRD